MTIKRPYSAGSEPCILGIRVARENDRHIGTDDQPGPMCVRDKHKLLGEHVARFQVKDDEDVGAAGNQRGDSLRAWQHTFPSVRSEADNG